MRVILASASPRRKELLANLVSEFEVIPSEAEETFFSKDPKEIVCGLSKEKAQWVADRNRDAIVIGSDTMVFCDGAPMGKPANIEEARRMLRMLSGRVHQVYTGVTVIAPNGICTDAECTDVWFAEMTEEEIEAYLATKDSLDKAGAYGVQGYASRYIRKIDGDYFNVVGLPIRLTYLLLKELNVL